MTNTELLDKLRLISAEVAFGNLTRIEQAQAIDDLVAEIQADEAHDGQGQ